MVPEIIFDNAYQSFYAIKTDIPSDDDDEVKYVVVYEVNCDKEIMIKDINSKIQYLKDGFNNCTKDIWNTMLSKKDINEIANNLPHFPVVN